MSIHRLKIVLSDVRPLVWRRLEVDSGTPLPQLSRILLDAMGWDDEHLHQFLVAKTRYGVPDPDFPSDDLDERRFTLRQIAPHAKNGFRFEYDFGDGWEHRVTVEAITEIVAGTSYPRCIGGANACPPEDCGGPYGYAELLKTIADPSYPEHEHMLEWVGGDFDPSAFDLDRVNAGLRDARKEEGRVTIGHEEADSFTEVEKSQRP